MERMTTPSALRRIVPAMLSGLLFLTGPGGSGASASEPDPETAKDEAPETYKNTIRWATASEVDNFGFDVYRSESEDGPFERLNAEVIEGAGTTDEPSHYEFVDDTIDPRKAYYYYVESISMSGERELFTPIRRARPKLPAEDGDEAAEETDPPPDSESEGGGSASP